MQFGFNWGWVEANCGWRQGVACRISDYYRGSEMLSGLGVALELTAMSDIGADIRGM